MKKPDLTADDWNTIRMALELSTGSNDPEWDREASDLYEKLQRMGLI